MDIEDDIRNSENSTRVSKTNSQKNSNDFNPKNHE